MGVRRFDTVIIPCSGSLRTLLAASTMVLWNCGSGVAQESTSIKGGQFVFETSGSERFRVRLEPTEAERARASLHGASLFPSGRLIRGDGGYNKPWSWHLEQTVMTEVSVEVCDGRPSYVEADIAYWVDRLGRFCPASARGLAEE
jgi:hypothetical protein